MYKLILTDKTDPKMEMEFAFKELSDLTQFMSDAFETARHPLTATIGEEEV